MRWDRFFEDLEDQLDSEWEAERAALDTESERLRLSRVRLRERLVAIAAAGSARPVSCELADGSVLDGRVSRVGADWFGLTGAAHGDGERRLAVRPLWIVPLAAVQALTLPVEDMLGSVRDAAAGDTLGQRMGLGFVLRDVVRRRVGVTVRLTTGRVLHGTIDRAGADHLDLALHDAGQPRRSGAVTGFRVVPFEAIAAVALDAPLELP
ncbi:hypothetical protein [Microbacterium aurum]|uniref:hypothetical protein n=1 Tax=Microbacterium aurum TaxID=36805 RepID=UPI0028E1AF9B|nr:hypothetical protein [Microbacterium aurum]